MAIPPWLNDCWRWAPSRLCRRVVLAVDAPCRPVLGARVDGLRLIAPIAGEPGHLIPGDDGPHDIAMRPGTVLVVEPGCPVAVGSGMGRMYNTVFTRAGVRAVCWHREAPSRSPVHAVSCAVWQDVVGLWSLLRAQQGRKADDPVAVQLCRCLLALGRRCLREYPESLVPDDRFSQACELIEELLPAEIGRDDLAEALGMHPNHLSRLFAQRSEGGLASHIARQRLELTRRLLREDPAMTVSRAAELSGFSSASYCSQCCRRLLGGPPAQVLRDPVL